MSFKISTLAGVIILVIIALLFMAVASSAQPPELVISLSDTLGPTPETGILQVHMSNYQDTVSGFSLWLQLDRPDLILFQGDTAFVIDTTYWYCTNWVGPDCLDSVQAYPPEPYDWINIDSVQAFVADFDTTATLTGGWQYVAARSLTGTGTDIKISAIANLPGPPTVPGIPPQQHGNLINIPFVILNGPFDPEDCTVQIMVNHYDATQFCFSTPQGQCIGWNQVQIPDTTFLLCTYWIEDVCLNWQIVPSGEPYDSFFVEYVTELVLDTTAVVISDLSINVCDPPTLIGDFDCNGTVNIVDLVELVNYMFVGGPSSDCPWNLDCDGNGEGPNIADLVCIVNWMFPPQ